MLKLGILQLKTLALRKTTVDGVNELLVELEANDLALINVHQRLQCFRGLNSAIIHHETL